MNQVKVDALYTRKQQEVLRWYFNNDFFMLVNHGAVRTGKTFIDNDIFLHEAKRIGAHAKKYGIINPQYILAGASIGTLQRNIFSPLTQKYGIEFKLNRFNQFLLFGTQVCCFGHDDIGNLNAITGMTSYGAYINEGVKANNDVLKQIIKRCSADQHIRGRIIIDTNPDSPQHPIKTDYIDKADGKRIMSFHWVFDDNTFLSQEYKDDIIATTPSGIYTDRDIYGLWRTPEGAVYQDFNERVHVVNELPRREDGKFDFKYYYCGVDWGYEHKGSICLFGVTPDGITYMIKEITKQHKLIDYWVAQALEIMREYGNSIPFYCDPARPEHIKAFKNAGVWAVNADNSVLDGVEEVAKKYKTNTLLIYKAGIMEFLNEIYVFVWNPKTGEPVKVVNNVSVDDVMAAMRYGIYTNKKKWR